MDYLTPFLGAKSEIRSKRWGALQCEAISISPAIDGDLVIYFGNPLASDRPLVRIHSACVFSETFGDTFCDCADQLHIAMAHLKKEGAGMLFYLRMEGRGAGLAAKVKATDLEHKGMDTFDSRVAIGVAPEGRDFSGVGRFLVGKGVRRIRLLTNNPNKVDHLAGAGLDVAVEPIYVRDPTSDVQALYRAKKQRFGHAIPEHPQSEQLSLGL